MRCIGCGRFGHEAALCTTEPTSRKGQHNGGIRTLEDIQGRCVDVDGCWSWRGAFARNRNAPGVPVAWFALQGRVVSVPRMAVELAGRKVGPRQMVWRDCACADCVNPKHLRVGSRKQWGKWLASTGLWAGSVTQTATRRKARMASGDTLTMELAQWARESQQTGADVAFALDTSPTTVSRIRLRKTWAENAANSSIFALASTIGRGAA